MASHWTEDDFLNALYEVGPDDGHPAECPACRARLEEYRATRRAITTPPEIPPSLLAGQRRQIQTAIISRSIPPLLKWTPAAATVAIVLALALWKTPSTPPPSKTDAQLMTEIYQTVYTSEPAAFQPVHGLFTEKKAAHAAQ
ncbi:MAG: hypothetical protein IT165_36070 [Bryobacterales bacterium]|nr:hypothetical protein [Bryobacterales bacterium]